VSLSSKATVADAFIRVLRKWERQTGKKTKVIRTDGGTEFMGELDKFCEREGIIHEHSVPYTPQQNGRAERLNRVLLEKTRTLLFDAQLPTSFWAEAISTANYLRNIVVSSVVKCTPYELFFGKKPNVRMLRVFGSQAYVHVPKEKRGKFDKRSVKGVFVGYEPNCKGWRVLVRNGSSWRAVVSRDVVFDEGSFMSLNSDNIIEEAQYMLLPNDENECFPAAPVAQGVQDEEEEQPAEGQSEEEQPAEGQPAEEQPAEEQQEDDMPENLTMQANVPEQAPTIRQSRRVRWQPSRYQDEYPGRMAAVACEVLTDEPQSLAEVKERKDWSLWETSMHEELSALQAKGVYELVALPDGKKALPCRWVYKVKRDEQGRVDKISQGSLQKGFCRGSVESS
jgi:hypothetical protein